MISAVTQDKPCILLVDDEPKNIQLLGNLLREYGYTIEFATSGMDALRWLSMRLFDLILLDIMMPEMDGYDVCKRLKSNPITRGIPVIFLTAKTDAEGIARGFSLGAVDYVTKPFQKEELLARVKTHLTLQEQQRALDRYADLLEEKNLELRQKNLRLEESNANKDKFFSLIAHDLRSPMTGFLSLAELFENTDNMQPEQFKEFIRQFRASAENLFQLLENLLTWARIQRGLIGHAPQWANLGDIIHQNVALMAQNARQKKIVLVNSVAQEVFVYADTHMLEAIIRNLLSNALKFTKPGGNVDITTADAGDFVTVSISDNGIGMTEEKCAKLFRVGAKIQSKGTADEKGTGLGLILCKEFVEKNGGSIGVESRPERGTTVWFTLPKTPPAPA